MMTEQRLDYLIFFGTLGALFVLSSVLIFVIAA